MPSAQSQSIATLDLPPCGDKKRPDADAPGAIPLDHFANTRWRGEPSTIFVVRACASLCKSQVPGNGPAHDHDHLFDPAHFFVARAGNRDCERRSREGMAQSEVRRSECQCSGKAAGTKCRAHNHNRSQRSSCHHAETKSARTLMLRAQFHLTISPVADGVANRQQFSLCALVQVCASRNASA